MEAVQAAGERVSLVAVADIDDARAAAFKAKYAIPAYYTDPRQLLEREKPDLVLIATPPATHADLSIASLEAGAFVLCEKPLCRSLAEFDRITAAEERTGRYVTTIFQWRLGSAAAPLIGFRDRCVTRHPPTCCLPAPRELGTRH